MVGKLLAPAVWRLQANIEHKPYDMVNITSSECQLRLDPRVKSLVYPVIRKKHFHITLLSCDLSTNIQCIKRDYGSIRGLEVF